ncbi:MAG: phosphopantetheine-binding protein [Bacteroidetes bacterium]|nr:phosphopantetheine-binding protein [Bacteroidota bacterium]
MNIEEFIKNFESAVESAEPGSLASDSEFRVVIPGWDSLAALSVLAMIDAEYDVTIKANDFIACDKISDVYNLISRLKQ